MQSFELAACSRIYSTFDLTRQTESRTTLGQLDIFLTSFEQFLDDIELNVTQQNLIRFEKQYACKWVSDAKCDTSR